jgi:hypothetical protein
MRRVGWWCCGLASIEQSVRWLVYLFTRVILDALMVLVLYVVCEDLRRRCGNNLLMFALRSR